LQTFRASGSRLSEKLSAEQRRAIGWTLVAVGALTTIPLVRADEKLTAFLETKQLFDAYQARSYNELSLT